MAGLVITLLLGMVAFQLFSQSDRTFRDQNQIAALQQNVRAVASQIADDLRMAGQNVPLYSGKYDAGPIEACATILDGSDGAQVVFRGGVSNVTSRAATPTTFTLGTSAVVNVTSAANFNTAIGGVSGRFVYLYGKTPNLWGWVRAEVTAIDTGANTITVMPTQNGTTGATFASPTTMSLEEGIRYRLNGDAIQRGTVSNFTNLTSPTIVESDIGDNFTSLQFVYYDRTGAAITPNTLAIRSQVWRVDATIVGQTSQNLSNGTRPTFAMTVRAFPRNVGVD
jgi:hypothetical protein